MLRFSIDHFEAWAAGLSGRSSWENWLDQPSVRSELDVVPKLTEMPAAMRRRADKLGRAALQVAYWSEPSESNPIIFASRYGEISRSIGMLEQLAEGEVLSPTAFSMSVHNAIGALFSIARGSRNNYSAVAAGDETVEAAFTEALGLLAEGAPQVTIIYYESPLPVVYAHFETSASFTRAWACQIRIAKSGGISLQPSQLFDANVADIFPSDIKILRFLLSSNEPSLSHFVGGRCWNWKRYE